MKTQNLAEMHALSKKRSAAGQAATPRCRASTSVRGDLVDGKAPRRRPVFQ
jgi:hypothetical protein